MQIEIEEDVERQIQSMTTIKLKGRDFEYLAGLFLRIGIGTVQVSLKTCPEATCGKVMIKSYRNHCNL